MTVQFIKVTKKDRVCYAPVPEPLEEGDKLEIMEIKDEALFPPVRQKRKDFPIQESHGIRENE